MYHDLIILTNRFSTLLDLVPSPTRTRLVSTSFSLFPYFFLRLPFSSPLRSCSACPPLYFFPDSHPASLCHLFPSRCFLSNLPGDPQSPCISAFLPPSLASLPPNSLAPQVAVLPFSFLSQLLQPLGAPFSPSRILFVGQGL